MKKLFHVVITSHKLVIFRDEEDFLRCINCIGLICIRTGSRIDAFSLQSDHIHFTIMTDDLKRFVCLLRIAFSKYFNYKYSREGAVGDYPCFFLEIDGLYHTLAADSYVLRNALHHGVVIDVFGYEFNSSKCYFQEETGNRWLSNIDFSKYGKNQLLPKNCKIDPSFFMNKQGMIDYKFFVDARVVERNYSTVRSFRYHMNRYTSEEWKQEQERDKNDCPIITLNTIELPYSYDTRKIDKMLANEKRKSKDSRLLDIDVCQLIDNNYVKKMKVDSFALLTPDQKRAIADDISRKHYVSLKRCYRCLEYIPDKGKN